jgi:hypothetical protein
VAGRAVIIGAGAAAGIVAARAGAGAGAFVFDGGGELGRAGVACAERVVFVEVAAGRAACAVVVRAGEDFVVGERLVVGALVADAFDTGALVAGAFVAGAFFVTVFVAGLSLSPIGTMRKGGALDWASAAAPQIAKKLAAQKAIYERFM